MPGQSVAVGLTAFDETATSPTIGAGVDLYAVYGIDPGKIDLHGLPNRSAADLTHTGFDVGPTQYGTAALVPGTGGGNFLVPHAAEGWALTDGGRGYVARDEGRGWVPVAPS